ncbi:DNA/RNA polymerases superfamily protein [Gossypium australe]|uniref:DNA/RNA polymerases superfamily protein n=1 Tax=Gossypium australe TaxID=47621 RepID=A0A5B6WF55_9ROSI|nr:DNA/RNA polymerases superfamily protein [Gossypium australe]
MAALESLSAQINLERDEWDSLISNRLLEYQKFKEWINRVGLEGSMNFNLGSSGKLQYMRRLYVSEGGKLRLEILKEAHQWSFSLHLGNVQMYRDLKELFWWSEMKKEIS